MTKFVVLLASWAVLSTTQASAREAWTCQNNDYEISCNDEKCEAAEKGNFTPASVSITTKTLSVCAYSGCWEGKAKKVRDNNLVYVYAKQMKWSGTNGKAASFQIALDTKTGFATILGEHWAEPMHCKAQDQTQP